MLVCHYGPKTDQRPVELRDQQLQIKMSSLHLACQGMSLESAQEKADSGFQLAKPVLMPAGVDEGAHAYDEDVPALTPRLTPPMDMEHQKQILKTEGWSQRFGLLLSGCIATQLLQTINRPLRISKRLSDPWVKNPFVRLTPKPSFEETPSWKSEPLLGSMLSSGKKNDFSTTSPEFSGSTNPSG